MRYKFCLSLSVVMLGVALAGCGGNKDPEPPVATPTPAAPRPAAPAPVGKGPDSTVAFSAAQMRDMIGIAAPKGSGFEAPAMDFNAPAANIAKAVNSEGRFFQESRRLPALRRGRGHRSNCLLG